MRKIESKQKNIVFIYCKDPVTIDKSSSWGDGNIQNFPKGVFLKLNVHSEVTHGVQPNEENTAPEGWLKGTRGIGYNKKPIWIGEKLFPGEIKIINTLDGQIEYNIGEDSYICYNGEDSPNIQDSWIQSVRELEKNYEF